MNLRKDIKRCKLHSTSYIIQGDSELNIQTSPGLKVPSHDLKSPIYHKSIVSNISTVVFLLK